MKKIVPHPLMKNLMEKTSLHNNKKLFSTRVDNSIYHLGDMKIASR